MFHVWPQGCMRRSSVYNIIPSLKNFVQHVPFRMYKYMLLVRMYETRRALRKRVEYPLTLFGLRARRNYGFYQAVTKLNKQRLTLLPSSFAPSFFFWNVFWCFLRTSYTGVSELPKVWKFPASKTAGRGDERDLWALLYSTSSCDDFCCNDLA